MQTAVAAVAVQAVRRQVVRALAAADVELLCMPADARGALEALNALRPDLLVADAQLPYMEGATLVRHALWEARLPVRPGAIVLRDPCFVFSGRAEVEEAGGIFVDKPVDPDAFSLAVNALRRGEFRFSPRDASNADALMDALGVPEHAGRDCLKAAALICAADERCLHHLSATLYPRAGASCGLSAVQAERAMRHVIDLAWQSDQFDNQYRIFADTVDAGRGQPTCGEMISRLADILRLEG